MKQLKFLAVALIATSMSLFLSSCGSGDDKKAEEAKNDTSTQKPQEPPPPPVPVKPSNVVVIMHKVANYAKWKMGYDAHDSARLAAGLKNYVLGRGLTDSNMVLVALKMDDLAKAKAFGASKDLMEAMKKAGVVGKPTVEYINVVMSDTTVTQAMRLRVTHKVKDWDAWKKSFDSHKQTRIDAGLIDRSVGYSMDDNHMVSVVFAVSDMAKAKAFTTSKDLKDKMAEAGVEGMPTFYWYKVAQKY
jgi:hypothetical protein